MDKDSSELDEVRCYCANVDRLGGTLAGAKRNTGALFGKFEESRRTWNDSAAKEVGQRFVMPLRTGSTEALTSLKQHHAQLKDAEPMLVETSASLKKAKELSVELRRLLDRARSEKDGAGRDMRHAESLLKEAESATLEARSMAASPGRLPAGRPSRDPRNFER